MTQAADCKLGTNRWRRLRRDLAVRAMTPISACLPRRLRHAFGILMYHRIAEHTPGVSAPTWNVTPERFRAQLAGLLQRGYQAWPLRKVLEHHRRGRPVPRNVFVVTFDDGYENVYTNAWPVLQELRVPATVFLATAWLDAEVPFPFDDWPAVGSVGRISESVQSVVRNQNSALRIDGWIGHPACNVPAESWRPLSTSQCRQMAADGLIELGTHTHTHRDFRGRPDLLLDDLLVSLEVLHKRFALSDATFAFPYGTKHLGFSGGELSFAARLSGVLCGLTTEDELVTPQTDVYGWGRFTVGESDTAATLAARLDGWYTACRNVWRKLRRR